MRLPNREGRPIDPVPFAVVALLGALVAITWGPLYLKEWGMAEPPAVAASSVIAVAVGGASYYRLVWTANPTVREEVPAHVRFRKLLYATVAGVIGALALMAALAHGT